jgi:hypothetical protein
MSTSHLTPVAVSAIVGGKTAFSVGCVCDGKQSSGKESRSIHGKNLAPPRQQSCRTVRSNRGKNLSVQTRSIARPASIDVQTGSLSRDRQSSAFVRAWRSFLRPACAMVPSTNILMVRQHVSSVPYADSCTAATASLFDHLVGAGGMVMPIALAVLRLTRSQ